MADFAVRHAEVCVIHGPSRVWGRDRLTQPEAGAYTTLTPMVLSRFLCALALALPLTSSAQEPVINRGAPTTLTGEIVDISCYKQKGVAAGTGAAHMDCAKLCVRTKGAGVGILSDGDGLFRLWGNMARDQYAKLVPYLGQNVEITGTEVMLSNNYDVRSFDVQTIKAAKK
jgi:hypothetical protein